MSTEVPIRFMDPKLYKAAADGNFHALQRFDDIPVQLTPKGNTVLHIAAQFGQAKCVRRILQSPSLSSILLRQPNERGDTPLHLAAREGHLTAVKNLIAAAKQLQGDTERGGAVVCKVMLRMCNEEGDTALHEAVSYHHPDVVKLLIEEDSDFIYGANSEGNTPLYIAADRGFGDLVKIILDNYSSPHYSDTKGRTALHAAVILNDQVITRKILKWKPDLSKELDETGWSPLHFAAYVGCHRTIVRQLLEKSERYVVYLGVKYLEIGNSTALHIAASRGHMEVVKVLLSHFPDCCEKVDDHGNNVLHLLMLDEKTFVTSGLSSIRCLRVKGLMNEKNVEGKTPLQLFDDTSASAKDDDIFFHPETMFMAIWDTLERFMKYMRRSTVSMRRSSSLEIKKDSGSSSESTENEKISEMKKTIKSHMIVAALIATVTFTAGFTLPGGYVQNGNNNISIEGMAVLSLPTNATNGTDPYMATSAREQFWTFVSYDSVAMLLSLSAIGIYSIASFPIKDIKAVRAYLILGHVLTLFAMLKMVIAFVAGLQAVLYPSSLPKTTALLFQFYGFLFWGPMVLITSLNPRLLCGKRVKSY